MYEYECRCGKTTEKVCKVTRIPRRVRCECGWMAKKVLSRSAIQADSITDVKWLPSALQTLQKDGERPITSRKEYNRYLKENQIVQKA